MAKKKSNNKKSTKKKATKKKAAVRKVAKKKTAKKAKKKAVKKKAVKKKAKKSVKKKSVKKKKARKKPTKKTVRKKLPSFAEQLFHADSLPAGRSITVSRSQSAHTPVEYFATPNELRKELARRRDELEQQRQRANAVLTNVIRLAIQKGQFGRVTGCCVCFRRKHDRIVSPLSYVVQVAVDSKLKEDTLASRGIECVPQEIDGIAIKVIESQPRIGRRTSDASDPPDRVMPTGKFNDVDLIELRDTGISLSDTDLMGGLPAEEMNSRNWGTLGITFKRGRKKYAMVNSHFADRIGTVFVQPSFRPDDLANWEIGKVVATLEGTLDPSEDAAHVDAAIIELSSERNAVNAVIEFGGESLLFANRKLNQFDDVLATVYKYGARTREKRQGFVDVANYGDLEIDGNRLGEVIKAQRSARGSFSDVGDSGCLLIAPVLAGTRHRLLAVGICFADDQRNDEFVYACHMKSVIDGLGFDVPDRLLLDSWSYPDPV